jgi:transposase
MLGKKVYQEKLFTNLQLSQKIPENNFYRRLNNALHLDFLYHETKTNYGDCGQKSIDPVVFFKLCLVGYLENIISDRQLMEHCSLRLDILFFLGYDVDEDLPWHSTLSRTRKLYPDGTFEKLFNHILALCIEKGLVSGHTQAVDSALIKANASMDSLELKVPKDTLEDHLRKVRVMSSADRPAKVNKATKEQQTITADKQKLKDIESRQAKWRKDQDQRVGANNIGSKYTSNKTHYSPTDPDARIAVKPGKPRKLNYLSQMAVDTAHHVITHIHADFADKKDNQCLAAIVNSLKVRLKKQGLLWTNILADAGYSSGENYAMLEREQLQSFIPPHGTYKGGPDGFEYFKDGDYWVCPQGKQVTYRKNKIEKGTLKRYYYTRRKDCKGCPIKDTCIGKSFEKKIAITAYKDQYDRAIKRVKSTQGKYMRKKRLSTVEPVFGTLINFMGMRKINTIGMVQANKVMLLAAIAYNLKKYLNHKVTHAESMVNSLNLNKYRLFAEIKRFYNLFYHRFLIFTLESGVIKIQNI